MSCASLTTIACSQCSLTAADEVAAVRGDVAEVQCHSPVASALLGRAPRREQRVEKDQSTNKQFHVALLPQFSC